MWLVPVGEAVPVRLGIEKENRFVEQGKRKETKKNYTLNLETEEFAVIGNSKFWDGKSLLNLEMKILL